ncbi:hypothetical protein GCM10011608_11330 [Micromonospora sonchi]|uniref:Chromosome segregation ATPase n=1 Tax=Micromonospora sonchi TaxID=1763543 RepID=A0A917TMN1_9ACTN|nr:hypothetical protein [Micromonospora sonchi]GGM28237.1 hypothetical protein GCM10011608_11330 [Micromonospora sonchi]
MTAPHTADGSANVDIVGPRVLAGVQMVNISRLSTHPVPITPRGLITVAGQGPSDSNGAGKSSFIAGISLLHADDQWRLQSGAQDAAELLFTAELAGQEVVHANADHGYIIGVYVPPSTQTLPELEASVLTVWLRINRQAPHVELRWATRLHVAFGDTENDRAEGADGQWDALPRSNGRTDLRANKLARTLYGQTVRCVSFLSTSVRASATANLLAQPLNELTPERIFDAIGALTGLNREIEDEQKARQVEYQHADEARQARTDYEAWNTRVTVIEDLIHAREQARTLRAEADDHWRSRCARHLVDGVVLADELAHDISNLDATKTEFDAAIDTADGDLARLRDDKALEANFRTRKKTYDDTKAAVDALGKQQTANIAQIELHTATARGLRQTAAAADGRSVEQAEQELSAAENAVEAAQRAAGVTEQRLRDARDELAAAERGEDVAVAQVQALRAEDITAVPLVDVISLTEPQRAVWEARLLPYRHAVVVADAAAAAVALDGLPGSLLIEADPAGTPAGDGLPLPADPATTVHRFLAALRDRAGSADTHLDTTTGVHGVAGFPEAITGRAGRIEKARTAVNAAVTADDTAAGTLKTARKARRRADDRVTGAKAAVEADKLDTTVKTLRAANTRIDEELGTLETPLAQARAEYDKALGEKTSRDQQIAAITSQRDGLKEQRRLNRVTWQEKTAQKTAVNLPARQAAWQGTTDTAHQHLLTLTEAEQHRSSADWDDLCVGQADRLQYVCFPPGTPAEQLPEELRIINQQRRDRHFGANTRLVPHVLRIVGTHLDGLAELDQEQLDQIRTDRGNLTRTLSSAEAAMREAQLASAALRATLAKAIKTKLKQVSDEFNTLDTTYGGYGGALDYPEPEPPADPQKPWQWTITPRWRRGEGKPLSPYRLRGNTAQMDDKAVKLVCAAALAGATDRPLLLILDELGRNLGSAHRRDAVALFENIGRDRAISVIGALQDDMERYAVGSSSLYIKLRRTSDTHAYNQAPIVVGSESETARVQLLTDWITSYRPQPLT